MRGMLPSIPQPCADALRRGCSSIARFDPSWTKASPHWGFALARDHQARKVYLGSATTLSERLQTWMWTRIDGAKNGVTVKGVEDRAKLAYLQLVRLANNPSLFGEQARGHVSDDLMALFAKKFELYRTQGVTPHLTVNDVNVKLCNYFRLTPHDHELRADMRLGDMVRHARKVTERDDWIVTALFRVAAREMLVLSPTSANTRGEVFEYPNAEHVLLMTTRPASSWAKVDEWDWYISDLDGAVALQEAEQESRKPAYAEK